MAWFEREFIAVPADRKNQVVYKWPDVNIRRYTRVIVNADEVAVFIKSGHVVGAMGPGRHRVDADELPVLGALVDSFTGGNFYRAELYFIATREFAGIKFGGRLADIVDPVSEQVVTLRAFGEFALAVRDPAELLTSLAGTTDLTDPTQLTNWSADLLLKSMKIAVTQGIAERDWQILGLSAKLASIEAAVVRQTNIALYEYGLRIPRMGNFDITLSPEDADRLKRLAKDVTYIRLAGDFQSYAAGELALGASQGFAAGGHDGHGHSGHHHGPEGGFLGAALGMQALQQRATNHATPLQSAPSTPVPAPRARSPWQTAQLAANPEQLPSSQPHPGEAPIGQSPTPNAPEQLPNDAAHPPITPAQPPITPAQLPNTPASNKSAPQPCTNCQAENPTDAKFCTQCGTPLAPPRKHCPACGATPPPTAKFCGACGTPTPAHQ